MNILSCKHACEFCVGMCALKCNTGQKSQFKLRRPGKSEGNGVVYKQKVTKKNQVNGMDRLVIRGRRENRLALGIERIRNIASMI